MLHKIRLIPGLDKQSSDTGAEGKWVNADYTRFRYGFPEKVGDMLIYSGCELEHWREPFQGNVCSQVFLHYNHANGPFAKTNLFDKRPLLGIPK